VNESILDKKVVLELNRFWMPVKWRTPKEAMITLSSKDDEVTGFVIDPIMVDGKMVDAPRYTLDEWLTLPVRPEDVTIMTKTGPVRCPLIIVSANYRDMPLKPPAFSPDAIKRRDNFTCQVSGRYLGPDGGNLGHDQARSLGGKKTFENIVYMDPELNRIQGTKTFEEMGWPLLKTPVQPKPVPACSTLNEPKFPIHAEFLPCR